MTLTKLGELIEQSFEINFQGKYKASDVRGMTITKEVIPTKAKIKNTDLNCTPKVRQKKSNFWGVLL